jgi:nucleotide-binding universal stress UspA family protein
VQAHEWKGNSIDRFHLWFAVREGEVEILTQAKETPCDLIVMVTHGQTLARDYAARLIVVYVT